MSHSNSTQFGWVGQFSAFVAGEKSPYQYLTIQVAMADTPSPGAAITDSGALDHFSPETQSHHQIKLSGSLRRMMVGYLQPQDWIRVVGKVKTDKRTGEPQWKAREIVKISTQQAIQYAKKQADAMAVARPPAQADVAPAKAKPTRVLICQKSSCRQRGSQAVEAAIARAISTYKPLQPIQIQPTGCMKQCKSGPHVVFVSAKRSQLTPAILKHTHVTPELAKQVIESMSVAGDSAET